LASSIESVYLVEASPCLREKQRQLLCGGAPLEEIDIGYQSISKYSQIPVTWCEDIRFVPNGTSYFLLKGKVSTLLTSCSEPTKSPFIFAHEFFDALPIHAFQSVPPNPNQSSRTLETPTGPLPLTKSSFQSKTPQWRELVVNPTPPPSNITTSTSALKPHPDFQLSIAKASTPNSLLLPKLSPRYEAVLPNPGSTIEISPESRSYAAEFARRIGGSPPKADQNPTAYSNKQTSPSPATKPTPSGAALILDYGPASTIPSSTLRGIRTHAQTSPFSSPGLVDISADVDFLALTEAALDASPGVEVHGPLEQGIWLEAMGIRARAEIICKTQDEEGRKRVRLAVERLVERGGGRMGRIYKCLAIVPERGGRRPVGFGGGVV